MLGVCGQIDPAKTGRLEFTKTIVSGPRVEGMALCGEAHL